MRSETSHEYRTCTPYQFCGGASQVNICSKHRSGVDLPLCNVSKPSISICTNRTEGTDICFNTTGKENIYGQTPTFPSQKNSSSCQEETEKSQRDCGNGIGAVFYKGVNIWRVVILNSTTYCLNTSLIGWYQKNCPLFMTFWFLKLKVAETIYPRTTYH